LCLSSPVYGDEVYRAVDGDTIKTSEGVYIRLLGIDTPEIRGLCKKEKQLALEAKSYLQIILDNAQEIEVKAGHKSDKYGRLLAHVYADGLDLSSLMLQSGMARIYDGGKRDGWCG
jgi:endonuclease YncB( thermonuclease family)